MTWQRIDENTYIDDTLVTCAEYQLFIDEMREQGENYTPWHWVSFQFPLGTAREPILGVPPSYVEAFCKWLTKYSSGSWFYRMPTIVDANEGSLKVSIKANVGYWVKIPDSYQFFWNGSIPENDLIAAIEKIHDSATEILIVHNESLVKTPRFNLQPIEKSLIDEMIKSLIAIAQARPFEFDLDVNDNGFKPHQHYFFERTQEQIIESIDDSLRIILASAFDNYRPNSSYPDLPSVLSGITSIGERGRQLSNVSYFSYLLSSVFEKIRERERIAGRSPAFEGIRLAKERIR
jgi:hypothetical protein